MHGHAAASGQITRHADNIDAVRVRFAAVKDASASIARDDSTYGLLCRWITENFRAKHVRQDELVAYVEENLRLIGESLRNVLDQLTGKPNVITSHAATWYNMAVELRSMAEELEDFVEYDLPGWHGDEADEHRRLMANNVEAIKGLGSVSAGLAEITESVGVLVASASS